MGCQKSGRVDVPGDFPWGSFPHYDGEPSGTTEADRRNEAINNLTPNAAGHANYEHYWSEACVVRHETFHMDEWEGEYMELAFDLAETIMDQLTVDVNYVDINPDTVLIAHYDSYFGIVRDAMRDAFNLFEPECEIRAFAHDKEFLEELVASITQTEP